MDPNPSVRAEAALAYAEAQGPEAHARLLDLLDDPDPTVRMVAHRGLEQATGTQSTYRAFGPAAERRAAIAVWRTQLGIEPDPSTGTFGAAPNPSSPNPPSPNPPSPNPPSPSPSPSPDGYAGSEGDS